MIGRSILSRAPFFFFFFFVSGFGPRNNWLGLAYVKLFDEVVNSLLNTDVEF